MRILAILAVVLLAGCANAGEIVRAHRSTVLLTMEDGICSGTAVGRHTVLTAEHCLTGTHTLAIDGKPVKVVKIILDHRDHALVTVSRTFKRWARIGKPPVQGDTVFIIGNPGQLRDMYRKGYVSGVQTIGRNAWMLIDLNAYFGDSGSGIFDDSGRVVGVISVLQQQQDRGYMKLMGALSMAFTDAQWASIR